MLIQDQAFSGRIGKNEKLPFRARNKPNQFAMSIVRHGYYLPDGSSFQLPEDVLEPVVKHNPRYCITNGFAVIAPVLIQTLFVWRYSSIASIPFSRPKPESL
jgi:hypothetical protein